MPIFTNIRRRPVYLCLDVGLESTGQREVMTSEGLPRLIAKCRFLNQSKGVIRRPRAETANWSFNLDVPERTSCIETLYEREEFAPADASESVVNILARYCCW
jgi:hypothetical protein